MGANDATADTVAPHRRDGAVHKCPSQLSLRKEGLTYIIGAVIAPHQSCVRFRPHLSVPHRSVRTR